jgi:hypothetical protein
MSASNLLKSDGKIANQYLPNPYPFPATPAGLGEVLQVNNSALTPIGAIPQDATDFNTIGCIKIETGTVGQGNNLALVIGEAGDTLQIKGATTKGSLLVGNGANTEEFAVPAPPPPNGSVLILDSTQPLGVRWGGESGPIATITAGNNIDILGTSANPIVAFQTPTTANIRLGVGTELEAKDNYVSPTLTMSIDNTGLNDKYDVGGVVNQEDITVSATSVQDTISTTNTTDYINSSVLTCDTNFVNEVKTSQVITSGFQKSAQTSITCNTAGSNPIAQIGCGVSAPTTSPFPDINANVVIGCSDPSTPQISISQSAPFAPTYSTIIDKDGISQNNSSGSGLTINSNSLNCSITSGATTAISGQFITLTGSGGGVQLSAPAGNITSTSSAGQQVVVSTLNNVSIPTLTITNSNASTASYPVIKTDRPTPASVAGDVIGAISTWADDGAGTSREWSRIQTKTENVTGGNQDGTLSIFTSVNGTVSEVMNFNGAQNENNSFRPLDMNGNNIRTTSGDMVITAFTSSGTGNLSCSAKGYGQYGAETGFTNIYNTNGNITFNAGGVASDWEMNCANWESPTASGNSGQHLRIKLNGTYYKIQLLND